MKIVLIDDEADIREIVTVALEASGFEVVASGSASAAIELIRDEAPDLVLLDHELGAVTGTEVLRRIRADDGIRETRVVFLTAHTDRSIRASLVEAGALGIIDKPFDPVTLASEVESYHGGTPAPAVNAGHSRPAPVLDEGCIDSLRSFESTRPGFVRWLIDELERDTVARIRQIREARNDKEAVAREAHALRSSAGNLGAVRLSSLATRLEKKARDRSDPLESLIEEIERAFRETLEALAKYR